MKTALSMRNSFLIGFLIAGTAGALAATSSRETDLLDRPAEAPVIELRPGPSAAPDSRAAPQERTGNPLWAIPLSSLTATNERPIFSPTRRYPPKAVANVSTATPSKPSAPASPPVIQEKLSLKLVGTIGNGSEGIAIFTEPSTQAVIRLRLGEAYGGWILQSVRGREASLGKGGQVETVSLPRPGESSASGAK
jgi:hypothetical protein